MAVKKAKPEAIKRSRGRPRKVTQLAKPKHTYFGSKCEWSAWVRGADTEWFSSKEALELAEVFEGYMPNWLAELEPWVPATSSGFSTYRKNILGLSVQQCAALLGVSPSSIKGWESERNNKCSKMAYLVLRLIYKTTAQRISHKSWDGWFVNKAGELVCPETRMHLTADELRGFPFVLNHVSMLKSIVENLSQEKAHLVAENIALRSTDRVRCIAGELEDMQSRIAEMLSGIRTAEIIEFNQPASQLYRRA